MSSHYKLDERPEYVRATLKWELFDHYPIAYITQNQISSRLLNCKKANALLQLPKRTKSQQMLQQGDLVSAILINKMAY
jgi:gephyrin